MAVPTARLPLKCYLATLGAASPVYCFEHSTAHTRPRLERLNNHHTHQRNEHMSPPDNTPHSAEVVALLTHLNEGKRRGLQRLSATTGPADARHKHIRTQLFLAKREHEGLQVMSHTLAQHVGRPVAQALTVRLALHRLGEEAERSLSDPAVAARLKNDLMSVRSERAAPAHRIPTDTPTT